MHKVGSLVFTLSLLCGSLMGQFTEVSRASGIHHTYFTGTAMGGGGAWFDYDADGDDDLYLVGGVSYGDSLYENIGGGMFVNVTVAAGLSGMGSAWTQGVATGDVNNDGFREIFVTTVHPQACHLLRNNGDKTFTDISAAAGITDAAWSISATFGDYNLDGFLDIYVGNYVRTYGAVTYDTLGNIIAMGHTGWKNFLYLNNGNMTFSESAELHMAADSGCALANAFTDYNKDSRPDISVVNDFGYWIIPNTVLLNQPGTPAFSDQGVATGMDIQQFGMGVAIGDYDHDLDLDYYFTNMGENSLMNSQNNGTSFIDTAAFAGVVNGYVDTLLNTSWGCAFMDYDNDTWQDLWVENGFVVAPAAFRDPNALYHNNGDGTFTDVTVVENVTDSSIGRGFAYADYDNDGDVDMLSVNVSTPGAQLYRNDQANGNHWLQIKTEGVVNNRDGFGALIRIVVGGDSWVHEVDGGSSHLSHNSSIAHFGLAASTNVDSICITWPGGAVQCTTNIAADQRITIVEDTLTLLPYTESPENPLLADPETFADKLFSYPNPSQGLTHIAYSVAEKTPVTLEIYNTVGQRVALLVDQVHEAGEYVVDWDGRSDAGRAAGAGVYLILLKTKGKDLHDKLILQR